MSNESRSDRPAPELLLQMLERMLLIRRTEEQLGADSKAGKLPGNVHLCVGQEAISVGVCAHLTAADHIGGTHRGHGHFLAKGGTPRQLIAEVYGKRTGACGGLGGSMHVADLTKGMLGANGIVGGGIPLAAGAALAAQADGQKRVSVAFFGDGAASQGVLSEVLNLAALWRLPLLLVCEHNCYSEFSPSDTVTAGRIVDRAAPFNVPSEVIDGNDVVAVWQSAGRLIDRARRGDGPALIEARTYRLHGHLEAEAGFLQGKYRSDDEISLWRARDPITRLATMLSESGSLAEGGLAAIDAAVMEVVADAVRFADESPLPDLSQVSEAVFFRQEA